MTQRVSPKAHASRLWALFVMLALASTLVGRPITAWADDSNWNGTGSETELGGSASGDIELPEVGIGTQTTSLRVLVAWYADDAASRPEQVSIHLLANGSQTETRTLSTADATTESLTGIPEGYTALWATTFEKLPTREGSETIEYLVSQDAAEGYACSSQAWNGGQLLINTYEASTPPTTPSLDGAQVTLSEDSFTYDGTAKEPGVTVTLDGTEVDPANYQVGYVDNTNAGTATVTVTGTGDYEGSVSATFVIAPLTIENATVTGIQNKTYNATAQTQDLTVTLGETVLTEDEDYTVAYANNKNAGTATVTITGKGNYASQITKTFTIAKRSITAATVTGIVNKTYNGSAQAQAPTVKVDGSTLAKGTHYTLSYANNKNAGTATVTITGKGNYSGSVSKTFTIAPKQVSPTFALSATSYTYDGKAKTPAVSKVAAAKVNLTTSSYSVAYAKGRTNAGTYKVTVTLKGNYKGSASKTFTIKPRSLAKATVTGIKNKTFNGAAQTQALVVKLGTVKLTKGTHYTVAYANNKNAGTATLVIKGKGNYTGSIKKTFKIAQRDFSKATVAAIAKQLYTGSAIKPAPVVKWGGTTLKNGTDYTVSYKNNVKLGKATVTITGKGNYTAKTKTATFTIYKAAIGGARVSLSSTSVDWDGHAHTPSVTITYGGKALRQGVDYTVRYANNVKPGSASIIITGKRGFTGTVTKHFTVTGGGTVYLTKTGECYHLSWCRSLRSSAIPTTLYNARSRGYRPCSICNP